MTAELQAKRPEIKPGFKLGGGLANNFGQDTYDQEWLGAVAGGFFLNLRLNHQLIAGVEMLFLRKGSVYRLNLNDSKYQEKYVLDYLEIPVFIKYFPLKKGPFSFYFYAGPSIGLNLKARL
ncbi:MAG: porin family protein, partial [Candidatus Saccharicenans sp.]